MESGGIFDLIINSNLTWAAALTLMSFTLRPVLTLLAQGLIEARREQTRALEVRNQNEKEQTRVLSEVRDTLSDNAKITSAVLSLIQNVASIPAAIEEANKRMTARADARDAMLAAQARSLEQIHQAVTAVPDVYMLRSSSHFDPQFTKLMVAIDGLKAEIQNTQDVLTPGVVKEIRTELGRITKHLSAIADREEQRISRGKQREEI